MAEAGEQEHLRMAEALQMVTACLYDVWRCNTDEERAHHGERVAILCDRFLKHPERIAADFGSSEHRD